MSQATETIEKLAADLGENIYLEIAGWHLYLAEAKLHSRLATEFYPQLIGPTLQAPDVTNVLQAITVSLGGGQTELPLTALIPKNVQAQVLEILQNWQREF